MSSIPMLGGWLTRPMRRALLIVALAVPTLLAGCTAATTRVQATAEPVGSDQYVFRIRMGGLAQSDTADKRARQEIEAFRVQQNYLGYEILDRHFNLVPPYYEYTVRFSRKS